jgi:hypothetical protein
MGAHFGNHPATRPPSKWESVENLDHGVLPPNMDPLKDA